MQKSKQDVRREAIQVCRRLRRRQTRSEKILWEMLRDRRFMNLKFFRQYPFFHEEDGSLRFYIVDFFCRERKVVIELDGPSHSGSREYDAERSDILAGSGIRVVRFSNKSVENDVVGVLRKLKESLDG